MKALFTLTSSESKRLIARGVAALPVIQKALLSHTVVISGGTTDAFVAEELLHLRIEDKTGFTVGIVTNGEPGLSTSPNKLHPFVVTKGKPQEIHWKEYLPKMEAGDVFIKGGSAIDHTGLSAVMVSDSAAGTIGAAQGILYARGIPLVVPIGLEKMVPDVRQAVEFLTPLPDVALGQKVGLVPMLGAMVITELTALRLLYDVEARAIASGGVGGSEGAVTLAIEGSEAGVNQALDAIKGLKGEPAVRYLS